MIPVERAGIEAILPEVAGATAARVQIVCIAAVGAPEGHGKGIRLIRYGHQVDVIRHEAVGKNAEARLAGGGAQQVEVDLTVGLGEEDAIAVGSTLSYVMGQADGDGTSKSGHREYSGRSKDYSLRNIADCPRSGSESGKWKTRTDTLLGAQGAAVFDCFPH